MDEIVTTFPEIITISEKTNLRLSRSNTFVPESQLILGEKVKNVKLLSEEKFAVVSSEKGPKRILVYTVEVKEKLIWRDLNIKDILNNAINVDQINYFISRNKGCFINCAITALVELDGRSFLIKLSDAEKKFYQEIDLNDQIPEGKIKIFFAKE